MRRKNTRSARKKDKLRKQTERAQVQQSFIYQTHSNEWKNEQINRLQIPSPLLGTRSQDTSSPLPLTQPSAVYPIIGDGNCLFSALSYALTGTEKHHRRIRLSICNFMKTNPNDITSLLPTSTLDAQSYLTANRMELNGTWGTEIEITTAAVLLQTNIYVYSKHGVHWKWIKHSPSNIHTNQGIYLYHKDENHFVVVVAVENSEVPSHLSPDQYYCPQTERHALKRKHKQETEKERISKRYKIDDTFNSRKKETQKRLYNTDKENRAKKLNSMKDKYKRDNSYKTKKIQLLKERYHRDTRVRGKRTQYEIIINVPITNLCESN